MKCCHADGFEIIGVGSIGHYLEKAEKGDVIRQRSWNRAATVLANKQVHSCHKKGQGIQYLMMSILKVLREFLEGDRDTDPTVVRSLFEAAAQHLELAVWHQRWLPSPWDAMYRTDMERQLQRSFSVSDLQQKPGRVCFVKVIFAWLNCSRTMSGNNMFVDETISAC